jgi:putative hydrolase of the HAD superfamily
LRAFADVNVWIFDLDNTLYPRHTKLFDQVDKRIRDYVARVLDIPPDEAHRLQKDYYRRYGTTLRGLMLEHAVEPDEFLKFVHDVDHSRLTPDPRLGQAIRRLPGRRFIFTNGSRSHAQKVSERLGFTDEFEQIFDILWADLVPKPHRDTYAKLIAETGIDPQRAAMFEDLSRNLEVPHALGMRTVLIVPEHAGDGGHVEWETEGRDAPFIEHVTDDLSGFVETLAAALDAR